MERVILPLVQTLFVQSLGRDTGDDGPAALEVSRVLRRKIGAMPVLLRAAMTLLTHGFNIYGLVVCGRLFCAQDFYQRRRQVQQWQNSPLGPCREFVGFYEKMTAFIYYSLYAKLPNSP